MGRPIGEVWLLDKVGLDLGKGRQCAMCGAIWSKEEDLFIFSSDAPRCARCIEGKKKKRRGKLRPAFELPAKERLDVVGLSDGCGHRGTGIPRTYLSFCACQGCLDNDDTWPKGDVYSLAKGVPNRVSKEHE